MHFHLNVHIFSRHLDSSRWRTGDQYDSAVGDLDVRTHGFQNLTGSWPNYRRYFAQVLLQVHLVFRS